MSIRLVFALLAGLLLGPLGRAPATAISCAQVSCDDGNPCTVDACDEIIGCTHSLRELEPCDDGLACTSGDTCLDGQCRGFADCPEDENPCTTASCGLQGCGFVLNNDLCDDGNACTQFDQCVNGTCAAGTARNCNDGNTCTIDTCNPTDGTCSSAPASGTCDDGDSCTTGDQCVDGLCQAGTPASCDDGNPCTADACQAGVGCVHVPDDRNLCSDGSACTSSDHCDGGFCVGDAITCPEDASVCTTAVCTPLTGCGFVDNTASCDDGNPCTLNDQCSGGACQGGTPTDCNDGNLCTDDACDALTGSCQHANNTAACNDGDACTTNDVCTDGTCHGGSTVACDDGNPCTTDTCGALGCTHTPDDGASCSDGSLCTTNDHCSGGVCVGSTVTCPDDSNPCTTPSCNPSAGCGFVANTATCDDGNPCTMNDVCAFGSCSGGTPKDCSDGNLCTDDACSAGDGSCTHANNTASCDDGDACTTGDTCDGGVCHPGTGVGCDDGNPCTTDACDGVGGCTHMPNDAGVCTDGSVCTTNDHCSSGVCVGDAVTCPDDDNPCTSPVCNATSGCGFALNTASCDDGNPCTVNDVCAAGACRAGTPMTCSDANPCTDDTCDVADGTCKHAPNTASCSDGDTCTTNDHCAGGTCQPGSPLSCADDNPCTTNEVCVTGLGCQHTNAVGPCDDGSMCTTGDQCQSGVCIGARTTCPDDDNPCTVPLCDAQTGCGFVETTGPCDDGDPATTGDTCVSGACVGTRPNTCSPAPATGCTAPKPRGASITLKDATEAKKDSIAWRWAGGANLPRTFLGTPATSTNLRLCVYAHSGGVPSLLLSAPFPAGGRCGKRDCWGDSKKGISYRGNDATGNLKLQFKSGDKPSVSLSGTGPRLAMPTLPPAVDPALIVQLQRDDDAACVTARYPGPGDGKPGSFKAKSE